MEIENARPEDLPEIMAIYDKARDFMREAGNPHQWAGGYPSRELVKADIEAGHCRLCRQQGEILGVFSFFTESDPTYAKIYGGRWLRDGPYGTIHRIAVRTHGKGVAAFCFRWCFRKIGNLRIDTHRDNRPMQRALEKNGFRRCGIIYLADGQERIAFQKTE